MKIIKNISDYVNQSLNCSQPERLYQEPIEICTIKMKQKSTIVM